MKTISLSLFFLALLSTTDASSKGSGERSSTTPLISDATSQSTLAFAHLTSVRSPHLPLDLSSLQRVPSMADHDTTCAELEAIKRIYAKGTQHHRAHRYDEAISSFKDAINLSKEIAGCDRLFIASIWHDLGNAYGEKKAFANGIEAFLHAKEIRTEILGAQHRDTLLSSKNLGTALLKKGRHEEAVIELKELREHYQSRISYLEKSIADPEVRELKIHCALSCHVLAYALYYLAESESIIDKEPIYKEAVDMMQQAAHMRETLLDENDLATALSFHWLSKICNEIADPTYTSLGVEAAEKAIAIREGYPSEEETLGASYYNLGRALQKQGRFEDSIAAYHEAIEKLSLYPLPKYDSYKLKVYRYLGDAHSKLKQHHKAIQAYREARRLEKESAAPAKEQQKTCAQIAASYTQIGQHALALVSYKEIMEPYISEGYDEFDPFLLEISHKIAEAHGHLGHDEEAIAIYRKIKLIEITQYTKASLPVATTSEKIGDIYLAMQAYAKAIDQFQTAFCIFKLEVEWKKEDQIENAIRTGLKLAATHLQSKKEGSTETAKKIYEEIKQIEKIIAKEERTDRVLSEIYADFAQLLYEIKAYKIARRPCMQAIIWAGLKFTKRVGDMRHLLGCLYHREAKYEKAKLSQELAIKIYEEVEETLHDEIRRSYFSKGLTLHQIAKREKVEREKQILYHEAATDFESSLRIAKEIGTSPESILRTYVWIGKSYELFQSYQKAGIAYYKAQEYEKAIPLLIKDTEVSVKKIKTYYYLAQSFYQLERYKEATTATIVAQGLIKKEGKERSIQKARIHILRARIYRAQPTKIHQAIREYIQGIQIYNITLGKEDEETAAAYDELAETYRRKQEYSNAKTHCIQAVEARLSIILQKSASPLISVDEELDEKVDVPARLIEKVHLKSLHDLKMESYPFHESPEIATKIARSIFALGHIYSLQGNGKEAKIAYKYAYEIAKIALGESDLFTQQAKAKYEKLSGSLKAHTKRKRRSQRRSAISMILPEAKPITTERVSTSKKKSSKKKKSKPEAIAFADAIKTQQESTLRLSMPPSHAAAKSSDHWTS